MVKIITGTKGTGKTKVLIDMINKAAKETAAMRCALTRVKSLDTIFHIQ